MKIKAFFYKYYLLPPIIVLALNLTSSFVTRFFITDRNFYDITCVFDRQIPFIPEFIYIYVLAFVQWAVCLISVMIIDRKKSLYYCTAMNIGLVISGIVFLLFPTVMVIRPEFSGGGALTELLGKFIFSADTPPMNIFPSIHCLFSWGCARAVFSVKRIPKTVKALNFVFTVLVFLSVLFVKQHNLADIPAGIIAFETGVFVVWLSGRKKVSRANEKIEEKQPALRG